MTINKIDSQKVENTNLKGETKMEKMRIQEIPGSMTAAELMVKYQGLSRSAAFRMVKTGWAEIGYKTKKVTVFTEESREMFDESEAERIEKMAWQIYHHSRYGFYRFPNLAEELVREGVVRMVECYGTMDQDRAGDRRYDGLYAIAEQAMTSVLKSEFRRGENEVLDVELETEDDEDGSYLDRCSGTVEDGDPEAAFSRKYSGKLVSSRTVEAGDRAEVLGWRAE